MRQLGEEVQGMLEGNETAAEAAAKAQAKWEAQF